MMRFLLILLLVTAALPLVSQTKGALLPRFDSQREGDHFVYQWNAFQTSNAEIDEAEALAEEVFAHLTRIFGSERMPENKLIITFRGEGVDREKGKKRTPHVDNQGRTHLYRFEMGGYLSPLPHELVHAVRVGMGLNWQGFFEEGIASGIAYHLYPERKGFPRFGYSLDLIAGHWLSSNRGIPIMKMMVQHSRLNLKCQLQTYVTREDFFNYLIKEFGISKMVDLAYSDLVGSNDGYQKYFGKKLEALVEDWQADLTKRYKAIDQPEIQLSQYFNHTSARYIPVCEAGTDF